MLARGADPVQVYSGQYPGSRARPAPSSGTWGAPILPPGLDQFTADQQPNPRPVDDLSRFVMDRIRVAESDPAVDMVPKFYSQPNGAMAHRYASNVRRDMVAFRLIVDEYCSEWTARIAEHPAEKAGAFDRFRGLRWAVRAIAMRFAEHPDFQEAWRLE